MIQAVKDWVLEWRIWWAWERFYACADRAGQRELEREAKALQGLRSERQIERMERRMGLR